MRSLPVPHALWKALLVLMLVSFALPTPVRAQTQTKTQTKTKSRTKTRSKSKPKAKSPAPEPEKAPEPATQKAPEPATQKAAEPAPAPAPEKAPVAPKAPAPKPQTVAKPPEKVLPQSVVQAQERAEARAKLRVGVALDLFTEKSSLSGEQAINASSTDQSFDYSGGNILSVTLSMSVPASVAKERARIGGGVRLFGNYSAGGDHTYGFGLLNQAFVLGEYGLPIADKTELVFGGRVGFSLLIPGHDFSAEIDRLQAQGVDVWSVPRVGWLVGLSAGVRRRMSDHILLRADLLGQLDKLYLFSTSQELEGIQFEKHWSTFGLRIGLTLGVEFAI